MSITAVITNPNNTLLLSDGLVLDVDGVDPGNFKITPDRVHATNISKIGKITNQIGVMWMGSGSLLPQKFVEQTTATTLAEASIQLREFIERELDLSLMDQPWFNVNVHLVGYEPDGLRMVQIATKDGRLQVSRSPIIEGQQLFCLHVLMDREQARMTLFSAIQQAGDPLQGFTNFVNSTVEIESEIFTLTLKKK